MENKEELAIFGGKPVRENKIFYGRQYIDQADVDAVAAVMTSDYITCGPKVKELEQHLCELTHATPLWYVTVPLHCIWRRWQQALVREMRLS